MKQIHNTYSKWIKPLEAISMNFFTIIFVSIEIVLFFNTQVLLEYIHNYGADSRFSTLSDYLMNISITDLQVSIVTTTGFYVAAYLLYWFFIYKFWEPKWEKKRLENVEGFKVANQRHAQTLVDELEK